MKTRETIERLKQQILPQDESEYFLNWNVLMHILMCMYLHHKEYNVSKVTANIAVPHDCTCVNIVKLLHSSDEHNFSLC